jgi:mRNA-degrading endonuclease RelE of RelBE toxin-antitoxin system
MAQTYRHDACADRPQTDGVRGNRRWDVKALKGVAGMRLRAGDWRVLFTVKGNTITIHAVGHRRDIYD